MKAKWLHLVPFLITAGVVSLLGLLRLAPPTRLLPELEWMTYDWRMRQAGDSRAPVAPNLGAIYIDDESLEALNETGRYQWPWPRNLFGFLLEELAAQGAKAVAFDIYFLDRSRDLPDDRVPVTGHDQPLSGDDFFAYQIRRSGNVILCAAPGLTAGGKLGLQMPQALFRTNAWSVGHDGLRAAGDSEGVFRRAKAFIGDGPDQRVWHVGIVLAARELQLDLAHAVVKPGCIRLQGPGNVERIIPVDRDNNLLIDWRLPVNDERLHQNNILQILAAHGRREAGQGGSKEWQGKLVVVGASATGNDVSDKGQTPLSRSTPLCSSMWNVANSVLTNRFIQPSSQTTDLLLIAALAILAAALSWKLRALWATAGVLLLAVLYLQTGVWLFAHHRYWIPLVLPVAGALLMTHVCMVVYRSLMERQAQRFVRSAFGRLVSPNVIRALLEREAPSFGGSLRSISILYADVRGFTEFTESSHARALDQVRQRRLTGPEAEGWLDAEARATLGTVNLYLSLIAEVVKSYDGTLDKYIGDCVMAFWGAPLSDEHHAVNCVRAAVAIQRAIAALNLEREAENRRREAELPARAAAGRPPLPRLAVLPVGCAINSGTATAGFMGSAAHVSNYTVFGREVIIASRLEDHAGSGQILITEATRAGLQRDDPVLAASCLAREPVRLRGFQDPAMVYEVPWNIGPPAVDPAAR